MDGRAARFALDLNVVGLVVVKNDQRASAESYANTPSSGEQEGAKKPLGSLHDAGLRY
jgi:hypothetical protein